MGIIGSLVHGRARKIGATHPSGPGSWLLSLGGGDISPNAAKINERTAMQIAVVKACIGNIAEDIAKLPLLTYRQLARGKERVVDHDVYALMRSRPNPEMSAFSLRETLIANALGHGNGYAEIERRNSGKPLALWWMSPEATQVDRTRDGELVYVYRGDGRRSPVTLAADQVFHVHGLGFDGLTGYSVVRMAREAMGMAWAAERFGTSFFGNGANPGGTLEHPGKLTEPAYKRLKDSWVEKHQGPERFGGVEILEEGMKYNRISINNEDAQFLETRQFQIEEICRWYRMPPHKVQHLARSTNNNIEHQGIEYVTDCLHGWMVRFEQEGNAKLFLERERDLFIEHLAAALLRGDTKARYEAYAIGRQWGWLSANDVRELENMNPIPGEGGEIYLVPVNMTTPEKLLAPPPPPPDAAAPALPAPDDDDPEDDPAAEAKPVQDPAERARAAARTLEPVLAQAYRDILRRESDKVRKAMKQADPAAEVGRLYAEHQDHVRSVVFPVAEAAAGLARTLLGATIDAAQLVADLAARHCSSSRAQLSAAMVARAVDPMLEAWQNTRADRAAGEDVGIIAAEMARAATQGGGS